MNLKSRRWLLLLLLIPVGFGFARLKLSVEMLDLLPQDSPIVQGLKIYQENFSYSRELYVTVTSSEAETTEDVARSLAAALRAQSNLVSQVTWQPPWLESPAQASELVAFIWLNQPPEVFGELTNHLAPENLPAVLSEAREQLTTSMSPSEIALRGYDPFNLLKLPDSVTSGAPAMGTGQDMFSSPDGKFRLLFVEAKPELRTYKECDAWLKSIQSIVANLQSSGQISNAAKINYTGRPAFVSEIAGGMEHDMTTSVGLTALIIAILFWIAHRRWIPMLWLLVLLALILVCTIAIGGLIFGTINVVSLGFAGILLGLAVDYGVVHYQEAMAKPDATVPEIRNAIRPSIIWAAITTISAFLVLNLGGLPGLGQLGSIVAIGIALSALVMLFAFLPPLFRDRLKKRREQIAAGTFPSQASEEKFVPNSIAPRQKKTIFGLTALLFLFCAIVLFGWGFPRLDRSPDALRPQGSQAFAAVEQMKNALGKIQEPLWVIIAATNETEVLQRLEFSKTQLDIAVSNQFISSYTLPTVLWPNPTNQLANRPAIKQLIAEKEILREAAIKEGFSTNSFVLTENLLQVWNSALTQNKTFWPTNPVSRWAMEKVTARKNDQLMAVGLINSVTNSNGEADMKQTQEFIRTFTPDLQKEKILLSGWSVLGSSMFERVEKTFPRVLLPMVFLVLLSLWMAFRRAKEILLSLAILCISGFCLLAVMRVLGWSWNLLNIMALPLILGTGVDYSIFMQLALRRHNGNLPASHHSVGRALLLCGGTAVAGFSSLSFSTNAGMASLGEVCAVGIGANMLISVYLLPMWWRTLSRRSNLENA